MEFSKEKKIIFSGVQPSGNLTIGNYLGAIGNWKAFEEQYNSIYCVADMHAITVRQNPAELRRRTYETLALYIASGLDPEKNILFVQSHVPAHAELAWVLNCYTMFGELSRMTQFKDKSAKNAQNINAGLFTYPTLMAADILLYQTDLVPVGIDQKQHVEITRDIATRFNQIYSETFRLPEIYTPKAGKKINSLAEPTKKMSKSDDNEWATIHMLDEPDVITKKIKRAVTDSIGHVHYDKENQPGVSNLMSIHSAFSGKNFEEIEKMYEGQGYGVFKKDLIDLIVDQMSPILSRYKELMGSPELDSILDEGAAKAHARASITYNKAIHAMGLDRK